MGANISTEEKAVHRMFKLILKKNNVMIEGNNLKRLLRWVAAETSRIDSANIYIPKKWDEARVKLWDADTRFDAMAAGLLGPWRVVFEVLKKQVSAKEPT